MGSTFINLHVRAASTDEVGRALRSTAATPAFVSDLSKSGWISVYPSSVEESPEALHDAGIRLSRTLNAPVLAIFLYDSDLFIYFLINDGLLIDTYQSHPGYFEGRDEQPNVMYPERLLPYSRFGESVTDLKQILSQVDAKGKALSRADAAILELRWNYSEMLSKNPSLPSLEAMIQRTRDVYAEMDAKLAEAARQMGLDPGQRVISGETVLVTLAGWLGLPADRATASYRWIEDGERPLGEIQLISAAQR